MTILIGATRPGTKLMVISWNQEKRYQNHEDVEALRKDGAEDIIMPLGPSGYEKVYL